MRTSIIAAIMLAGAGSAQAGEWHYLGGDVRTGFVQGIETSSIRKSGNIVMLWTVSVYPAANADGRDYTLSLYRFDCQAGSMGAMSHEDFRLDGSPIGSPREGGAPIFATPDSFAGANLRAACNDEIDRSLPPQETAQIFAEVGRRMLTRP